MEAEWPASDKFWCHLDGVAAGGGEDVRDVVEARERVHVRRAELEQLVVREDDDLGVEDSTSVSRTTHHSSFNHIM